MTWQGLPWTYCGYELSIKMSCHVLKIRQQWQVTWHLRCHWDKIAILTKFEPLVAPEVVKMTNSVSHFRVLCVSLRFGTGDFFPYHSGLPHWYWGNHKNVQCQCSNPDKYGIGQLQEFIKTTKNATKSRTFPWDLLHFICAAFLL